MANLEPDFAYHSRFNPKKAFTGVKYGANGKLLEVELNEMQELLSHSQRQLTRSMYPDGLFYGSTLSYADNRVRLLNAVVVVDGDIIEVEDISLPVSSIALGGKVYLRKGFSVVTHNDPIHEFGNILSNDLVPNDILDTRYGEETSQRIQLQFTLTPTNTVLPNNSYLELGYMSTPAREGTGTGTNRIFVQTVQTFIPLWQLQSSYYMDGGSFSDEYTRLIDGGYFHENSKRVLDGGEF